MLECLYHQTLSLQRGRFEKRFVRLFLLLESLDRPAAAVKLFRPLDSQNNKAFWAVRAVIGIVIALPRAPREHGKVLRKLRSLTQFWKANCRSRIYSSAKDRTDPSNNTPAMILLLSLLHAGSKATEADLTANGNDAASAGLSSPADIPAHFDTDYLVLSRPTAWTVDKANCANPPVQNRRSHHDFDLGRSPLG